MQDGSNILGRHQESLARTHRMRKGGLEGAEVGGDLELEDVPPDPVLHEEPLCDVRVEGVEGGPDAYGVEEHLEPGLRLGDVCRLVGACLPVDRWVAEEGGVFWLDLGDDVEGGGVCEEVCQEDLEEGVGGEEEVVGEDEVEGELGEHREEDAEEGGVGPRPVAPRLARPDVDGEGEVPEAGGGDPLPGHVVPLYRSEVLLEVLAKDGEARVEADVPEDRGHGEGGGEGEVAPRGGVEAVHGWMIG